MSDGAFIHILGAILAVLVLILLYIDTRRGN